MEKPYISIVIPTYNSALTLSQTIKACLIQDYPRDRLEIIVVDDGSIDDTKRVVKNSPVIYMYQKRKGPASARNNGWKSLKGEWLAFIDADCVPYKNWISKLAQHCGKDRIGAVAGSYAVGNSRYLLDKFVHYEIKYRHSMMGEHTNSFGTYNVLIKRSVLEELGGFDNRYSHASGEDSDLAYRIIKSGHKIYFEKDAMVIHNNILRFLKYLIIQFRHGYWRMRLYRGNSSMIRRDEYGYWKDFVEILLVILFMLGLLINLQNKLLISGFILAALFLIQLPFSLKVVTKEKDIRYLVFSFVTLIRGFVRVTGGMLGFVSFWIIRR